METVFTRRLVNLRRNLPATTFHENSVVGCFEKWLLPTDLLPSYDGSVAFNLDKEKEKNKAIAGAISLREDDFLNGIEEDVQIFLKRRGDQDAGTQAEKVKSDLARLIDGYVKSLNPKP